MRFLVLFLCTLLLAGFNLEAQNTNTQGYEIKFQALGIDDSYLYIQAYYGEEAYIFDSAKVKGHKAVVFKNKKKVIPTGIYTLTDRFGNEYLDLVINKDRYFAVMGLTLDRLSTTAVVSGSEENSQFIEFQKQNPRIQLTTQQKCFMSPCQNLF